MSSTSPAPYKPPINLDSIVLGLNSFKEIPPAVTIASATGRNSLTVNVICCNT